MTTIKPLLIRAKASLRDAGIPSYALDAELLLMHTLGISRERIICYPEQEVPPAKAEEYGILLQRRAGREPLSHILGKREFWGREFRVTRDTLDPRPDSETLIEAALAYFKGRPSPQKIMDLGTGTGCLLLTLLAEFPAAYGVAVDISPAALEVAKSNAMHLGLEKRVEFLLQCWAEGVIDTFDIIISNPPYIRDSDIIGLEPEVSANEPHIALSGGEDGLHCYREIIPQLPKLLKPEGIVVLEVGIGQAEDIAALLVANHLEIVQIAHDLAGVARCVVAKK